MDLLASEGGRHWRVRTPGWTSRSTGPGTPSPRCSSRTGSTGSAGTALDRAAASVLGLLAAGPRAGSREILLVAAQDEYVAPTARFEVTEV